MASAMGESEPLRFVALLRDRNVGGRYGSNLDIDEGFSVWGFLDSCILALFPDRRRVAIRVAEAEVVEIDGVGARGASAENESMLADRTRGVGAEADAAMLPLVSRIVLAGAAGLFAVVLVDADALLEE